MDRGENPRPWQLRTEELWAQLCDHVLPSCDGQRKGSEYTPILHVQNTQLKRRCVLAMAFLPVAEGRHGTNMKKVTKMAMGKDPGVGAASDVKCATVWMSLGDSSLEIWDAHRMVYISSRIDLYRVRKHVMFALEDPKRRKHKAVCTIDVNGVLQLWGAHTQHSLYEMQLDGLDGAVCTGLHASDVHHVWVGDSHGNFQVLSYRKLNAELPTWKYVHVGRVSSAIASMCHTVETSEVWLGCIGSIHIISTSTYEIRRTIEDPENRPTYGLLYSAVTGCVAATYQTGSTILQMYNVIRSGMPQCEERAIEDASDLMIHRVDATAVLSLVKNGKYAPQEIKGSDSYTVGVSACALGTRGVRLHLFLLGGVALVYNLIEQSIVQFNLDVGLDSCRSSIVVPGLTERIGYTVWACDTSGAMIVEASRHFRTFSALFSSQLDKSWPQFARLRQTGLTIEERIDKEMKERERRAKRRRAAPQAAEKGQLGANVSVAVSSSSLQLPSSLSSLSILSQNSGGGIPLSPHTNSSPVASSSNLLSLNTPHSALGGGSSPSHSSLGSPSFTSGNITLPSRSSSGSRIDNSDRPSRRICITKKAEWSWSTQNDCSTEDFLFICKDGQTRTVEGRIEAGAYTFQARLKDAGPGDGYLLIHFHVSEEKSDRVVFSTSRQMWDGVGGNCLSLSIDLLDILDAKWMLSITGVGELLLPRLVFRISPQKSQSEKTISPRSPVVEQSAISPPFRPPPPVPVTENIFYRGLRSVTTKQVVEGKSAATEDGRDVYAIALQYSAGYMWISYSSSTVHVHDAQGGDSVKEIDIPKSRAYILMELDGVEVYTDYSDGRVRKTNSPYLAVVALCDNGRIIVFNSESKSRSYTKETGHSGILKGAAILDMSRMKQRPREGSGGNLGGRDGGGSSGRGTNATEGLQDKYLCTADTEGNIFLWGLTGEHYEFVKIRQTCVDRVVRCVICHGSNIYLGTHSGEVLRLSGLTLEITWKWSVPSRVTVHNLLYVKESNVLLTMSSSDPLVFAWDIDTLQQVSVPKTSDSPVLSCGISSDSRVVAMGGFDANVQLWDGLTLSSLNVGSSSHTDSVRCLQFCTPEMLGNTYMLSLWSGSRDGSVVLWTISSLPIASGLQVLKLIKRKIVVRKLLQQERESFAEKAGGNNSPSAVKKKFRRSASGKLNLPNATTRSVSSLATSGGPSLHQILMKEIVNQKEKTNVHLDLFGRPPEAVVRQEMGESRWEAEKDSPFIPTFLAFLAETILHHSEDPQHLFRSPCDAGNMELLIDQFSIGRVDIVNLQTRSIHLAAGVFKKFFTDLPQAIVPRSVFDQLMRLEETRGDISHEELLEAARTILLYQVPKHNYCLLHFLLSFLRDLEVKRGINRKNIAITFAPHVLVRQAENIGNMNAQDMQRFVLETQTAPEILDGWIEHVADLFDDSSSPKPVNPIQFRKRAVNVDLSSLSNTSLTQSAILSPTGGYGSISARSTMGGAKDGDRAGQERGGDKVASTLSESNLQGKTSAAGKSGRLVGFSRHHTIDRARKSKLDKGSNDSASDGNKKMSPNKSGSSLPNESHMEALAKSGSSKLPSLKFKKEKDRGREVKGRHTISGDRSPRSPRESPPPVVGMLEVIDTSKGTRSKATRDRKLSRCKSSSDMGETKSPVSDTTLISLSHSVRATTSLFDLSLGETSGGEDLHLDLEDKTEVAEKKEKKVEKRVKRSKSKKN